MDFTQFDARKAAETPRELQLRHPVTGELLYGDGEARKKPCLVKVLGTESREAQAALRAVQKAKVKGDKASSKEQSLEDLHELMVDAATPLIKGFENVMRGAKPATLDDVGWFLNLQLINGQEGEKSFVEQITAFATSRSSFLGNGSAS